MLKFDETTVLVIKDGIPVIIFMDDVSADNMSKIFISQNSQNILSGFCLLVSNKGLAQMIVERFEAKIKIPRKPMEKHFCIIRQILIRPFCREIALFKASQKSLA